MNMTHYPKLDETVYARVLSCGLTVKVVPKEGFTRKMAYFVTDFGSIHNHFTFEGKIGKSRRASLIFWSIKCLSCRSGM